MSMFLGPIHYWLYEKINNQEKLTVKIAEYGQKNGWITNAEKYVKELPTLETVIDTDNIHGWLQAQIADAEIRYAELVNALVALDDTRINDIKEIAYDFGKSYALNMDANPEEAYKYFEDFFVNGMPCDHINSIVSEDENKIIWKMEQDIHAQYWQNGDTRHYYVIRKAVMDGILAETKLTVVEEDLQNYSIMLKEI